MKIYVKPTCTTCRKVLNILKDKKINFEDVNYFETPFTKEELKDLLEKLNLRPYELLRRNEKIFKELNLNKQHYTNDELIDLMIQHPDLIQRPIIIKDDKVYLGRPVEKIFDIIK
jgi:arsenate reductase (glutaredoxin)